MPHVNAYNIGLEEHVCPLPGNMNPYFTSYIRAYSSPSDLRYTQSVWVFAIAAAGQGFAMFIGGLIATKIGHRWTVLLGGWTTR